MTVARAKTHLISILFVLAYLFLLPLSLSTCIAESGSVIPNVRSILEAPLLPEGSNWNAPSTVLLSAENEYAQFDLPEVARIEGAVFQGDNNDRYQLSVSLDNSSWFPVWDISESTDGVGLRTRWVRFVAPVHAQYVRIVAIKGDGSFSVARLHLLSSFPNENPILDYSIPNTLPLRFGTLWGEGITIIKHILTTALFGLAVWGLTGWGIKYHRVLLVLITTTSMLVWPNALNFNGSSSVHYWEFYHYYVGAKYFPEIGYTKLYECTALAESEDGQRDHVAKRKMMRLTDNTVVSSDTILTHPKQCRDQFTDSRWEEFKGDIRWFRRHFPPNYDWDHSQLDHGFNATPVWMLTGRALASALPLSIENLKFIASLDIALLLLGAASLFWAFGLQACYAVAFFCLNHIANYDYTGGAFLRYDWFVCLTVSVALLQKRCPILAGSTYAASIGLRIFPVYLLIGPIIWIALNWNRGNSIDTPKLAIRFLFSALLTGIFLVSISTSGSMSNWKDFIENSKKHLSIEATNFMGLSYLARTKMRELDRVNTNEQVQPGISEQTAPIQSQVLGGLLTVLTIAAFAFWGGVRKHTFLFSLLAGIWWVFLVGIVSNYYFILLSLLLLFDPKLNLLLIGLCWASDIPFLMTQDESLRYLVLNYLVAFCSLAWLLGAYLRKPTVS